MKESKSSIHIEAGHISVTQHNDRSIPTINSIFKDETNEYDISGTQAIKRYHQTLKPRIEAYTNRTGQKLNKRTITHLSAIVNIKKSTTLKELAQVAAYLESEYGTSVFQIAIHRDEGHIKNGENLKNYHAHLEMIGIDSEGKSIRRKLTRSSLSILQDKTAEILGMERGINYIKEKKKRPKRLGTYDYKNAKQREEKINKMLETITEQKNSVDNALKELLPQLNLDVERGKRYSYEQIKHLVLNKFNELNAKINQLRKENKTYQASLKNAQIMFLELKQQKSKLEISLTRAQNESKEEDRTEDYTNYRMGM